MSADAQNVEELSDEELMLRYSQHGDMKAFEMIVLRHEKSLYNFIYYTVKSESLAQDILQETFMALVRKAEGYEPTAKLTTYMYTIAKNRCIDHFRKKSPKLTLDAPVGSGEDNGNTLVSLIADDNSPQSDLTAEKKRFQHALADALKELPEDQRRAFVLKEIDGLKFREIAEIEGVSLGTAKSRLRLALEKLQAELGEFEHSPIKES